VGLSRARRNKKPLEQADTYRDLLRWLRNLDDAQLNALVLTTAEADDFNGKDYYPLPALLPIC
jgi:hypothetical protein